MKEKEIKDKKKKKSKKAGKVILFLLLLVIILALLLFFGDGFGFGSGGGSGTEDGDSVAAIATVTDEEQTDAPVTEESGPLVVEITESAVKFGDREFESYEAFEEYFYENNSEGKEYILRDNQAIKATYDAVKTLLDSFDCNYSEETVN